MNQNWSTCLAKTIFPLFSHYRKSSQYSIAVAFLGIRKYKLGISYKFLRVFVYLDFGLLRLEFQNSIFHLNKIKIPSS